MSSVRAEEIHGMPNTETMQMKHEYLKEITDGFSEERIVGRGAFGIVYLGKDAEGREIAVKKLHNFVSEFDGKKFKKEFNNLSGLAHPNIVQLVGYCDEEEEVTQMYEGRHIIAIKMHRALCFEYMHNGNLRPHLKDVTTGFGWHDRYNIIKGICKGLNYLHTRENPILHFDLKPDNILLDRDMVPKIADFGLSRLVGEENTKRTISAVGTVGYLPPEYIMLQIISKEFDIYSLGVILLKIMVGLKGYSSIDERGREDFVKDVRDEWEKRLQATGGGSSLQKDLAQVQKCVELALQCIEEQKRKRPSIGEIVDQLDETEKRIGEIVDQLDEAEKRIGEIVDQLDETEKRTNSSASLLEEDSRSFSPVDLLASCGVKAAGCLRDAVLSCLGTLQ